MAIGEALWLKIKLGWDRFYWVPVAALMIVGVTWAAQLTKSPRKYTPVPVRITHFSPSDSRWNPGVIVHVETPDGVTGFASVSGEMIAGCKVGDILTARQAGLALKVEPRPCNGSRAPPN
jgi:hypothetical protein